MQIPKTHYNESIETCILGFADSVLLSIRAYASEMLISNFLFPLFTLPGKWALNEYDGLKKCNPR